MRKILLLCVAVLLISCMPSEVPKKPTTVSGIFHDLEGNTINLTELRGKWIIINYWASWCKPCFMEIPELNEFYKIHKNKNVVVIGVSFDHVKSIKDLRYIANKKMGIQFPVLTTDPAFGLGIQQPSVLPATYVINPKGEMQTELLGLQTKKSLAAAIKDV